jgi:hypothetical protein
MYEKAPEIKISFFFEGQCGEAIELDKITESLAIYPTKIRKLDDWPEAIKRPKVELPVELRPRCTWELDFDHKECMMVPHRFEEVITTLQGKEETINDLCASENLQTGFVVVIYAHHDCMPGIILTKEIVEFAASIRADIGFDMYLD